MNACVSRIGFDVSSTANYLPARTSQQGIARTSYCVQSMFASRSHGYAATQFRSGGGRTESKSRTVNNLRWVSHYRWHSDLTPMVMLAGMCSEADAL